MNLAEILIGAEIAFLLITIPILLLRKKDDGIAETTRKRLGPTKTDTILMTWAVILGLTLFSLSDLAIVLNYATNNIPYGILWVWLNPYYWTGTLYKWVVLGIQIVVMIPQYYLAKKGKLNWTMLHLLLFSTIYFRLMGVFQEVTPVLFAPFATINPAFSLILIFQKIPFWSFPPTLADPHYQCSALGQCIGYTVDRSIFLHGALNPDIATHFLILFWLVAPIYSWWKRRKGGWDENKFWRKMMIPHYSIMMTGFIIIMFFGCCAGYHWYG